MPRPPLPLRIPRAFFVAALGIGALVYGLIAGAVEASTDARKPDPEPGDLVPDAIID